MHRKDRTSMAIFPGAGAPPMARLWPWVGGTLKLFPAIFVLLLTATATAPAQWQIEESHTTASLRGIHNVGGGIAWASGTSGTVLRTRDDGKSWQTCPIPLAGTRDTAEKLDFRGIQAFDEKTAIVMSSGPGDQSRLYKTTDGCQTWKLPFTNPDKDGFWDALRFDPNRGFPVDHAGGVLLGDPVNGAFTLFATADGGETWTRRLEQKHDRSHDCSVEKFAALPGEAAFAASNEALEYGDNGSVYFVTGGAKSRLAYLGHFREFDGLLCSDISKFINLPLGGVPSKGAFASAAKMRGGQALRQMMVVGGDYSQPETSAATAVLVSLPPTDTLFPTQTYLSVRKSSHPPHGYRSAVAYDVPTKTWITVGPNGTDISTDDGRNWRPLTPSSIDDNDADKNWNALSLPFAVGPKGRIGKLRATAIEAHALPATSGGK